MPELVFLEPVAGSALTLCLGWAWEAGGHWRSANLLAIESPEPEGEKPAFPVAMGSREGHDRKKGQSEGHRMLSRYSTKPGGPP